VRSKTVHTEEVGDVHADDSLGRHAPSACIDGIGASVSVISFYDANAVRRAFEELCGQVLSLLALGDVLTVTSTPSRLVG